MRDRLEQARVYLVVEALPDPEPLLRSALGNGVDVVQLREKSRPDSEILAAARIFRRLCDEYGALFILNDRADLAGECGADGVHLGQDDLPLGEARSLLGERALVGLSTHSREQIEAAEDVDYIGVGPVFATPTKAGQPPVGLELVSTAASIARVPFFAIGGIDETNARDVVAAGARRLAVVRAIRDAADPGAATRALRAALNVI